MMLLERGLGRRGEEVVLSSINILLRREVQESLDSLLLIVHGGVRPFSEEVDGSNIFDVLLNRL